MKNVDEKEKKYRITENDFAFWAHKRIDNANVSCRNPMKNLTKTKKKKKNRQNNSTIKPSNGTPLITTFV